jgi:hypothetical protein
VGRDDGDIRDACPAQRPTAGYERVAGVEDVVDDDRPTARRANQSEMLDSARRAALARPHDRPVHAGGLRDGRRSLDGALVGRDKRDLLQPCGGQRVGQQLGW